MKESELMKEVVRRSVEPDLEDVSMRIIEDHEFTSDHPTATVTTSYLTRIVAAFAIVFTLGLVAGLIIMKSVLRKDPPVNTAPDIVDTRSGSYTDPSNGRSAIDPTEYPYLWINNDTYYSYSLAGSKLNAADMETITVTKEYMSYLNTLEFVGLVIGEGKNVDINSNYVRNGSAVFRSQNRETYYVYESPGKIYRFGRAESPDFPDEEKITLGKEIDTSTISDKICLTYNQKSVVLKEASSKIYGSQTEAKTDLKLDLKNARFLGIISDANFDHTICIRGIYAADGTSVFYNKDYNKVILYHVNADGAYLHIYDITDQ